MSPSRSVAEVMSTPAVTATAGETLADAAFRMAEHGVGSVVVVDGNRPTGILTERDLLRAAAGSAEPAVATVGEWMTADPHCVDPDTSIDEAWDDLARRHCRHFPVVVAGE